MAENWYFTLLSSLPHINSLFESRTTPMSRFQLEKRLSMLSSKDRDLLKRIESLIFWEYLPKNIDDNKLIRLASDTVSEIKTPSLLNYLYHELDRKTLISAIRQKKQGKSAPTNSNWSFGSRYEYIRRNWSNKVCGLGKTFHSISKIADAVSNGHPLAAEKMILLDRWKVLNELSQKHRFDFEAVVVYTMKWNLVSKWVSYNKQKSHERLKELIDKKIYEYGKSLQELNF